MGEIIKKEKHPILGLIFVYFLPDGKKVGPFLTFEEARLSLAHYIYSWGK